MCPLSVDTLAKVYRLFFMAAHNTAERHGVISINTAMITASIVTYHNPLDEISTIMKILDASVVDKVYIVDNASEESMREAVDIYNKAVYVPSANRGYGAGHNIAIHRAIDNDGTDFHIVLNSDLEFEPEIIGKIADFMRANPDVGTLQPLVTGPDGENQHTCRMLPTPADVFIRRFLPAGLFRKSRERYLLAHLDPTVARNVPYHQGSFMFLRADALRICGGFDERFFMYPEDIDLTRRIHRRFRTLYWPEVSIVHRHRAASYASGRMLWIHITNMIRYFNKWGWFFDSERRRFNAPLR